MKHSISKKIILLVAVGVLASSIVILCVSMFQMNNLINNNLHDHMHATQAVVARIKEQENQRLLHNAWMVTAMPQLIDALDAQDVPRIKEIAESTWFQLGLDAVNITDAHGVVLARGHSDIVGDDISGRPTTAAALGGRIRSGIMFDEQTALVPFTLRCDAPIMKDGEVLGALSLAIDIGSENYIDNLHLITGMHYGLYKDSTLIMTSLRDEDDNRLNGRVMENEYILDAVLGKGETVVVQTELLGIPQIAAYWPARDFNGQVVGMWAVAKPLTQHNKQTFNVMMIVIVASFGIMLLFVLAAGLLGNRIALPIRKVTDFAVQIAAGNHEATVEVAPGQDEVGQLVAALKTMVATLEARIKEIEQKRVEADHANKAKSTFLSTMSHEIRTPMNAILGVAEILLQNEMLDAETVEALERIYMSGDMLLGIINDILDLSKIEAGKLELMSAKYEFASLISDTAQLNMMRVGSKPIVFELTVDERIPSYLQGDELRVKQILNNLLSNAFKYTSEGTVKLNVTAQPNETQTMLIFSISDTGQGMTPAQVDALFDEYSRFNHETNRATEGTGLGMSITRNLIRMMDGEISVESEPGKGSVFTVHLPQGRLECDELGNEMAENLRRFKTNTRTQLKRVQISREPMPYGNILVVDDVETNIYVAKGLLTPYELNIDSAGSGFEAIDKVKKGLQFDIIFMDHMMPQMDGIETTIKLRDMGYDRPIVALTANAVAGQADVFLRNGFTDFISKPIDIRQMNMVLNRLIRDKQPPEVLEAARRQAEAKKDHETVSVTLPQEINPQLVEIFLRDAGNTLNAITAIIEKGEPYSEEDMRMYIIHTHGMKSALANINKMNLSAMAYKLEQLGRENNKTAITTETPAFIHQLRLCILELRPKNEPPHSDAPPDDATKTLLCEKMSQIKAACDDYNEDAIDAIINELKHKALPPSAKTCLSDISGHLLHSDFEKAGQAAEALAQQLAATDDGLTAPMKARQIFLSTAIDGLDLHKGFELYHENVVVFTKILRTFTLNMHTMLMSMDIDGDFSISDYRIKVHGIKGACYTIFAEQISKMANRLEDAAESGDVDYIRQHHAPFIQATTQLINEMDKMLAVVDAINPKPIKDKPDRQALAKLREACEDFDMLRADDIMTEIEGYQYTADDGLTLWLSENVALTNLTEVAAKLENLDY